MMTELVPARLSVSCAKAALEAHIEMLILPEGSELRFTSKDGHRSLIFTIQSYCSDYSCDGLSINKKPSMLTVYGIISGCSEEDVEQLWRELFGTF